METQQLDNPELDVNRDVGSLDEINSVESSPKPLLPETVAREEMAESVGEVVVEDTVKKQGGAEVIGEEPSRAVPREYDVNSSEAKRWGIPSDGESRHNISPDSSEVLLSSRPGSSLDRVTPTSLISNIRFFPVAAGGGGAPHPLKFESLSAGDRAKVEALGFSADSFNKLHVNSSALEQAIDKGLPEPLTFLLRTLNSADRSAGRRWGATLGVPLTITVADDHRLSPAKVEARNRQGRDRGARIQAIKQDIVDQPLKVHRSIKRVGGPIPVVRKLRQRQKAKQIFKVKKDEEMAKDIVKDNGLLGRGRKRRREILRSLKKIDREIMVDKSKLRLPRARLLRDLESDRRYLAERILKHHEQHAALKKNRLNPSELDEYF